MTRLLYTAEYLSEIIVGKADLKQPNQLIKHLFQLMRKLQNQKPKLIVPTRKGASMKYGASR